MKRLIFALFGALLSTAAVADGLVASSFSKPLSTTLQSYPLTFGNFSSAVAPLSGDLRGVGVAHQHTVTGATTLGQPSTGYQQFYESSGEILTYYNSSGYNASTSGNDGRTGTAGKVYQMYQYGQGDLTAIFCGGVVGSTRAGATSYLASPEVACLAGGLYAGAAGQYIEYLGDMNITDNGNDIAAVGAAWNFSRSSAAEGIGANWVGATMAASNYPLDAFWRLRGASAVGIDFSAATFAYYRLAAFNVSTAGSGYIVGDVLTVSGGSGALTPTSFRVTTINGSGGVTGVAVVNSGLYATPPLAATLYNNFTTTGGTGTGAVIAGQFDNGGAITLPPSGGSIKVSTDNGDLITNRSSIHGILRFDANGIKYGHVSDILNSGASTANNVQFGSYHNALGSNSTQFGSGTYDYAQNNGLYFASGAFTGGNRGAPQTSIRIFRASGTAAMRLTADQTAANSQNVYSAQASSAHNISIRVTAVNTTNGDAAVWKLKSGALTRASTGNAAYQGDLSSAATPDYFTGAGSTATVSVTADTTLQGLNVTFTPPNSNTWKVAATLEIDQVQ